MVAYSFQRQFVEPIRLGRKRQTIRQVGKRRHAGAGNALQLYSGMRTRHCQKIADAVCSGFGSIEIDFSGRVAWQVELGVDRWPSSGVIIDRYDLDEFAIADGFQGWLDLVEFWREHHFGGARPTGRWLGVIVKWDSVTLPRVSDGQIEGGVA